MEIQPTPIVSIKDPLLEEKGVALWLKREDLNHPLAPGNKCRKLKYNLAEAKKQGFKKLLTFGGAYSNHIHAVAGLGKVEGFETIGVIRGEGYAELNPTLRFAKEQGMHLHYMNRSTYREKESDRVLRMLEQQYGDVYLIPEGGTNALALKGCAELAGELPPFDYLCCPAGTGGTLAGLVSGAGGKGNLLGFSALKGNFLNAKVADLLALINCGHQNWRVTDEFCFGGYAKTKPELLEFITQFEAQHAILLDPIYTAKMMYGIWHRLKSDYFKPGSKVIVIHTGS